MDTQSSPSFIFSFSFPCLAGLLPGGRNVHQQCLFTFSKWISFYFYFEHQLSNFYISPVLIASIWKHSSVNYLSLIYLYHQSIIQTSIPCPSPLFLRSFPWVWERALGISKQALLTKCLPLFHQLLQNILTNKAREKCTNYTPVPRPIAGARTKLFGVIYLLTSRMQQNRPNFFSCLKSILII